MSETGTDGAPLTANPLTRAVLEIDAYASGLGWDQPARLFALVDTAHLRAHEPALADQLELDDTAGGLTPVEQEALPAGTALDEFLATIAWPQSIAGCALTVERLMLPPSAEATLPEHLNPRAERDGLGDWQGDDDADHGPRPGPGGQSGPRDAELAAWVAAHPQREEVRMTVAVLRTGGREAALRLRSKDAPTEVLTGADLVPGLAEALAATFA